MSVKMIQDLLCKKKVGPVLNFYEGFERKQALTFPELKTASENLAQALIEQGIRQEPVLISLPNCAEFAVSYFAVLLAGGIPVPITTPDYVSRDYFSSLVRHISKITEARYCLSFQSRLGGSPMQCLDPRSLNSKASFQPPEERGSDELALIQFSSGSTVEPKGVMLSHRNILANLEQIKRGMEVTTHDVLTSWLPFYHDMGLVGGLLSSLYNEVEAHFSTPSDFIASPKTWLRGICETKTSIIMGPNFLYKNLVKRIALGEREEFDLSHLRLALSGAEPVIALTCKNFLEAYQARGLKPTVMFPVYGMAENTLAVTFPKVGEAMIVLRANREILAQGRYLAGDSQDPEFVSCGWPLKDAELRVVSDNNDDNGKSLPDAVIGEIQYRSPSMTRGYWRAPTLTQELFSGDGWLKTGDLGFLDHGQLFITGRSKDVLILNGRKFFPQDIESVSAQVASFTVGRTAAVSIKINLQDQYIVAVETKEWLPWRRQALRKMVSQLSYGLTMRAPAAVYLLAPCSLPRTSSGKLKRFVLKEWFLNGNLRKREKRHFLDWLKAEFRIFVETVKYLRRNPRVQQSDHFRPQSSLLLVYLIRIFSEVVQVPEKNIEPKKSFLDYQLDSIQIVQLNTRLKKDLIEIPLIEFIGIQNLVQLRDYLLENHKTDVQNLKIEKG